MINGLRIKGKGGRKGAEKRSNDFIARRFKFDCIVGLLYRTIVLFVVNLRTLKIKWCSDMMLLFIRNGLNEEWLRNESKM